MSCPASMSSSAMTPIPLLPGNFWTLHCGRALPCRKHHTAAPLTKDSSHALDRWKDASLKPLVCALIGTRTRLVALDHATPVHAHVNATGITTATCGRTGTLLRFLVYAVIACASTVSVHQERFKVHRRRRSCAHSHSRCTAQTIRASADCTGHHVSTLCSAANMRSNERTPRPRAWVCRTTPCNAWVCRSSDLAVTMHTSR